MAAAVGLRLGTALIGALVPAVRGVRTSAMSELKVCPVKVEPCATRARRPGDVAAD